MSDRIEGFAMAPNWMVRDPSIPTRAKVVFLVLSSHTGRDGTWWIGHQQIGQESGFSVSTVIRALNELRDLGLVTWEQRTANGGLLENAYQVHLTPRSRHPRQDPPVTRDTTLLSRVTEHKEEPEEEPQEEPTPTVALRDDVERVCQRLVKHITDNGARTPTITTAWRDAARLLLDRDGIPEAEVNRVMDWSQADPFWMANVLSMPTFRKRFDQLRLKSRQNGAGSALSAKDRTAFAEDWASGAALADWESVMNPAQGVSR